jgi:hypothetical protein
LHELLAASWTPKGASSNHSSNNAKIFHFSFFIEVASRGNSPALTSQLTFPLDDRSPITLGFNEKDEFKSEMKNGK